MSYIGVDTDGTTVQSSTDPFDFSVTTTGSPNCIIAAFGGWQDADGAAHTVTYDQGGANQAMTYVAGWENDDASDAEIWHLQVFQLVNPTNTGAVTVRCDYSGTGDVFSPQCIVAWFDGVDTSSPIRASSAQEQDTGGTGTTTAIDTDGTADHFLCFAAGDNVGANTLNAADQTERVTALLMDGTSGEFLFATHDSPGTGTDTFSYTLEDAGIVTLYLNTPSSSSGALLLRSGPQELSGGLR